MDDNQSAEVKPQSGGEERREHERFALAIDAWADVTFDMGLFRKHTNMGRILDYSQGGMRLLFHDFPSDVHDRVLEKIKLITVKIERKSNLEPLRVKARVAWSNFYSKETEDRNPNDCLMGIQFSAEESIAIEQLNQQLN